eukprot:1193201-Prorocentrum_minimum.AAC.3
MVHELLLLHGPPVPITARLDAEKRKRRRRERSVRPSLRCSTTEETNAPPTSSGWWALEVLFSALRDELAAGARRELLPLMRVEGMTAARARALFNAGLTSPEAVSAAKEER